MSNCKKCGKQLHVMYPNDICVDCSQEKESLLYLVKELFKILDTVEESDNGRVFRPTNIETCRTLHAAKLKEILPKIRKIIK